MICRLISCDSRVPNQSLEVGESLVVGRNPKCKIKNLHCSRSHCVVELKDCKLCVKYSKTNSIELIKSGDFLKGPGFVYKVKIMGPQVLQPENGDSPEVIWSEHDSGKVLLGSYRNGGQPSSMIAAFDYDNTIIKTKSGKVFPVNRDDWKLFDDTFPVLISKLVNSGYRFVIISNQMGISTGTVDRAEIQARFADTVKRISLPCLILLAINDDIYRKPRTGLWDYLCDTLQPEAGVDLEKSFYVGDAAGREKSSNRKKDHSTGDLLFAANCGLNFMVPEEFFVFGKNFHKQTQIPNMSSKLLSDSCFKYHPTNEDHILVCCQSKRKIYDIKEILPDSQQYCIIFCGLAASGKSSFYRYHLEENGNVYINLDTLKSATKCMSMAKKCFATKENCVIDNTNVDKASRAKWIDLCKKSNVIPIVLYFKLPLKHIFHNNKYRKLTNRTTVSDVVIYTQNKKFEPPSLEECPSLYEVNFVPKFKDEREKQLYSMYLSEK